MPKKRSKAEQRKRENILAKRQRISVGELRNRLKSDGDSAAHLSQDDDTSNENSPSTVEEQGDAVTRGVHALLREEAREEMGREGAGELMEAAQEGARGKGSLSTINQCQRRRRGGGRRHRQ
jgi:hypothetical protein